jgi:putative SOS response-associated peptidase YedK
MCGRFGRIGEANCLGNDWSEAVIGLNTLGFGYNSYNCAPKQLQPVVTISKPKIFQLFLWGLIPADSSTPTPKYPYFNARAETLVKINPWKSIFPKQRCLVPATFFYEWPKKNGKAISGEPPRLFQLKSQNSFSFAGLWDAWKDPITGNYKPSFSIITTEPNDLVKPYHDRMPVILNAEHEKIWMNSKLGIQDVYEVLIPFEPSEMKCFTVSPLVGNTGNNDENLVKPIAWKN